MTSGRRLAVAVGLLVVLPLVAVLGLAWRIAWLSPLVDGENALPQTAAMQSVMPFIDRLGEGGSVARICTEVLEFARRAA